MGYSGAIKPVLLVHGPAVSTCLAFREWLERRLSMKKTLLSAVKSEKAFRVGAALSKA